MHKHGRLIQRGKASTDDRVFKQKGRAAMLRKQAISGQGIPGKTIDEESPASFRKKGNPVTTKLTSTRANVGNSATLCRYRFS
jgi:hypothetical protein